MDAVCCRTNNISRTAKSCGPGAPRLALSRQKRSADDGDNNVWSPGRSRISRKTIAQGRPVVPARTCGSAACFFLHADHGCDGHPAFPAPSSSKEGGMKRKTRTHRAARTRCHVPLNWHALRMRSMPFHCLCASEEDQQASAAGPAHRCPSGAKLPAPNISPMAQRSSHARRGRDPSSAMRPFSVNSRAEISQTTGVVAGQQGRSTGSCF